MEWKHNGETVTELPVGTEAFVYLITNLTDNRKYVGKKLAKFRKSRPPLKGKKNRRRYNVDSDWQDYWGSSEELKADVVALGTENFSREILYFCPTRGSASYLEMVEQVNRKVLESDEYYNGIINVRIKKSKSLAEFINTL
jgi:hypothetical protein